MTKCYELGAMTRVTIFTIAAVAFLCRAAATSPVTFESPGPDVRLTQQSERTGIENKWFALTGRVVALKVETDGDLRIALQDATGDREP